jgi:hypothetical protein
MATSLTTNGKKKISTFKKEFSLKFNYLTIQFLDKKRKEYDNELNLVSIRTKKGEDISISGQNKINSLESKFEKKLGIGIEVCYSKAGKLVRTKSNNDKTLSELNKWCESNGCDLIQGNKKISLKSGNEKKINKSKNKIESNFEEDNIEDFDTNLIEIKETIKKIRSIKDMKTKFDITIYTVDYSYFTSLVTFSIKGKELVLRRTNWYNDSYWTCEASLEDTLGSLLSFYDSESDTSYFLNLGNWLFSSSGEENNGYDLELVENKIPNSYFPKNVFDNDGELNLYKVHNEIMYNDKLEEVVIESPNKINIESGKISLEIDIPSLDYSERNYQDSNLSDEDSNDGLLSVAEQIAKLKADLQKDLDELEK